MWGERGPSRERRTGTVSFLHLWIIHVAGMSVAVCLTCMPLYLPFVHHVCLSTCRLFTVYASLLTVCSPCISLARGTCHTRTSVPGQVFFSSARTSTWTLSLCMWFYGSVAGTTASPLSSPSGKASFSLCLSRKRPFDCLSTRRALTRRAC